MTDVNNIAGQPGPQQTAPQPKQANSSYVNDYQPPAVTSDQTKVNSDHSLTNHGSMSDGPTDHGSTDHGSTDHGSTDHGPTDHGSASDDSVQASSIQKENIFYLLGVEKSSKEDKEAFLDEIQQVIWEDFVETDVKMLISAEEMSQLRQIMDKGDSPEVQEEMASFLEKLIPNLEDIMLEKALQLKEDMVMERMAGMREYFAGEADSLQKIDEAEALAKKGQWHQAAAVLNSLTNKKTEKK